jgi:hypothetical protein
VPFAVRRRETRQTTKPLSRSAREVRPYLLPNAIPALPTTHLNQPIYLVLTGWFHFTNTLSFSKAQKSAVRFSSHKSARHRFEQRLVWTGVPRGSGPYSKYESKRRVCGTRCVETHNPHRTTIEGWSNHDRRTNISRHPNRRLTTGAVLTLSIWQK